MSGSPRPFQRRFRDLDRVVDEVHAVFDGGRAAEVFADVLGEFGLLVVKLAIHEWIANLVQHAAFGARAPEIVLTIHPEPDGLRCVIEDNSDGFDFHGQLGRQEAAVYAVEPSERGRGLLMMIACTEELAYETAEEGRQRLAFVIRAPIMPGSLAPLFSATDDGFPDDGFPDDGFSDDGFSDEHLPDDGGAGVPERAS